MPSAIAIARCIRSRCRLLVREGPSVSGAEDPVPRTLVVQSGGTRSEAALPTLCCMTQAQRPSGRPRTQQRHRGDEDSHGMPARWPRLKRSAGGGRLDHVGCVLVAASESIRRKVLNEPSAVIGDTRRHPPVQQSRLSQLTVIHLPDARMADVKIRCLGTYGAAVSR
jgi:hypothetical protein